MLIENIYQRLLDQNICDSGYEFSVRFLGKSRSYYSVLKARKEEPSIEAIATLEVALKNTSSLFSDRHPIFTKTRISLQQLSNEVKDYREKRSNELLTQTY
jgi:hypothetical protein